MKARQRKEIRHEVWELYGGEWMFHVERATARAARAYAARLNAPIEGPGRYAYVRATFERALPNAPARRSRMRGLCGRHKRQNARPAVRQSGRRIRSVGASCCYAARRPRPEEVRASATSSAGLPKSAQSRPATRGRTSKHRSP